VQVDRRQRHINAGGPYQTVKSLPLFFRGSIGGSSGGLSSSQAGLIDNSNREKWLFIRVSTQLKALIIDHRSARLLELES
jgi:hypothetical protein